MSEQARSLTRDDTERWVLDTCRDLRLDVGGLDTDFFEAGGTSLTAMKLIARAEERYGEDVLPPDDLFAQSSVRQIAECIHRNYGPGKG